MTGRQTELRLLQRHLSGRGKKLFPNQVVFYNGVLGLTNPALLTNRMLEELSRLEVGRERRADSQIAGKIDYLLRCGLDSDSSNIGKHINDVPDNPIPRDHKLHYLDSRNRTEILRRLRAVVQYCLASRPARNALEEDDFAALLGQMKANLSAQSDTLRKADLLTPGVLANIIYEVVLAAFSRVRMSFSLPPEGERACPVNLEQQNAEFLARVDFYGNRNIDRFFALQRLAEHNVVAAAELAGVYYYGAEYLCVDEGENNDGWFRVERDYDLAARYYRKAATCDPPMAVACWSLGYMALRQKASVLKGEEAEAVAERYFRCALEQDYTPAYNSLGLIERERGDRLLAQWPELTAVERETMLAHYRRAMELWDEAGIRGWTYGHINIAEFLAEERYQQRVLPRLETQLRLKGPLDLRERWKLAAEQDNLWAMNCLALLECKRGDLARAEELWQQAARWGYPTARLNLALQVYGPEGPKADLSQYRKELENASAAGCARASYELARLSLSHSLREAADYLTRAEEQNYEKFNNELYHQICELRMQIR